MHPCLRIAEIIWLVFDEIDGTDSRRTSSYYALAQTCRSFQRPALAHLWESIPNLIPLVKCVGRDIWMVENKRDGWKLRFSRRISREDMVTIKRYASLVRHFGRPSSNPGPYSPRPKTYMTLEVWKRLRGGLGGATLFPNVRSVRFDDEYAMRFVALFSPRNLATFSLYLPFLGSKQAGLHRWMVTEFSTQCPSLKSLNLTYYSLHADDAIAGLSNWTSLSRFSLNYMSLNILQALSRYCSNSLRYLSFRTLKYDDTPSSSINMHFLALEELSAGFTKVTDAIQIIEYFTIGSSLKKLVVRIDSDSSTGEGRCLELFRTIKKHLDPLTELYVGQESDGNFKQYHHTNALVQLITTDFTTLTRIKISHMGRFYIGDEDLREMTGALPQLEEFSLLDGEYNPDRLRITAASLVYFATNCPSLTSLALGFDARTRRIPSFLEPLSRTSKLTLLDVLYTPVDDPSLVARFLCKVFPGIQHLCYSSQSADGAFLSAILGLMEAIGAPRPWAQVFSIYKSRRVSDTALNTLLNF